MIINEIRCDICEKEVKKYNTYYIQTNFGETINERYDICIDCKEKIEKLIIEIKHESYLAS